MSDLIPISGEQAKAIQEVAKFGGQSIDLAKSVGSYFAKVLGTVPEDIVGLLGGDALRIRRVENAARRIEEAKERLDARKTESQPPPLALLTPILGGGADEERPELTDLWSRLLAAAMDPMRVGTVRQAFIAAIHAMDPMDALVLAALPVPIPQFQPNAPAYLAGQLRRGREEVEVSLLHLIDLKILREVTTRIGTPVINPDRIDFTSFGRELVRVLRD